MKSAKRTTLRKKDLPILIIGLLFLGFILLAFILFGSLVYKLKDVDVGWEAVEGSKQLEYLKAEENALSLSQFLNVYERKEEPQQIDNFYKVYHGAKIQIYVAGNANFMLALDELSSRFIKNGWTHHPTLGGPDQLEKLKQEYLDSGIIRSGRALYYVKTNELGEMFGSIGDLNQNDRISPTPTDYGFGFVVEINYLE